MCAESFSSQGHTQWTKLVTKYLLMISRLKWDDDYFMLDCGRDNCHISNIVTRMKVIIGKALEWSDGEGPSFSQVLFKLTACSHWVEGWR